MCINGPTSDGKPLTGSGPLFETAMSCEDTSAWSTLLPFPSRFLYGPLLIPFFRSFLCESMHSSVIPYLTHRRQGLASSHFLQAFWQLVHAFLTWRRLERGACCWGRIWEGKGYMCIVITGSTEVSGGESGGSSPSRLLSSLEAIPSRVETRRMGRPLDS